MIQYYIFFKFVNKEKKDVTNAGFPNFSPTAIAILYLLMH